MGEDVTKLPNNDVLRKYVGAFGKIYCTSKSYLNEEKKKDNYGIIESEFKIYEFDKIASKTILHGDAVEVNLKTD